MTKILLVSDDGPKNFGLRILYKTLKNTYDVSVVFLTETSMVREALSRLEGQ